MDATTTERVAPDRSDPHRPAWPALAALAAVAAACAATAGAEPTRIAAADVIWQAGVGAVVTVASSRARPWARGLLVAAALVGAARTPWVLAGLAALAVLTVDVARTTRPGAATGDSDAAATGPDLLGALVGALAVQGALRLPATGFHGLPSLVTGIAMLAVAVSGYRHASRPAQRASRWTAAAAAAAVIAAGGALAVAAASAAPDLSTGVASAQRGLELLRLGQPDAASREFDRAARSFDDAQSALKASWADPARLLPLVGDQLDAMEGLAATGGDLAEVAATTSESGGYQDLHLEQGQIDLEQVRAMQAPVAESVEALRRAQVDVDAVRSPWLIPPVAGRVDALDEQIRATLPDAELAAEGLGVAPGLLGGDGPRRYLVLFTDPARAQPLGGTVAAYGILTADSGRLDVAGTGPVTDLGTDPAAIAELTATPDFPTAALRASEAYRAATGEQVDGVFAADPYALAGLLSLTGPVAVPGLIEPLSADNAVEVLVRRPSRDEADPGRFAAAAAATATAVVDRSLPGPRAIGAALGPQVEAGRLLLSSAVPREQAFFERLGADGSFAPVPGHDHLSVRGAGLAGTTIDRYVSREVDVQVSFDPATGEVASEVAVAITNDAPAGGLPDHVLGNDRGAPPGTAIVALSIFSPLAAVDADVDGEPATVASSDAWGGSHTLEVPVPPGGTVTVHLRLAGTVEPGPTYHLDLWGQPSANVDRMAIAVSGAGGASPRPEPGWTTADGTVSLAFEADGVVALAVAFEER